MKGNKEILNDPVFLEIKNGNIGDIDNKGFTIDANHSIKLMWLKNKFGYDFNVCSCEGGYIYYVLDQDRGWKSVYKSETFADHDDCYRAAIVKIVKLGEKKII